jgi:hypothetical protein
LEIGFPLGFSPNAKIEIRTISTAFILFIIRD